MYVVVCSFQDFDGNGGDIDMNCICGGLKSLYLMLKNVRMIVCAGSRDSRWFKPWKFLPSDYIDDIESKLLINQGTRKRRTKSTSFTTTKATSVSTRKTTNTKKALES